MDPESSKALLIVALSTFRLVAAATKTPKDDQIADALQSIVQTLLTRPQVDAWAVAHTVLAAARHYADRTARTGDDKLVGEFQAVAAALEGVIGSEVTAAQLRDVVIEWPYLDAPGVARA